MESWDDLRFVAAVVRAGTLTGAAAALGVNQTTVTRRLQQLEQRSGARLFDRLRGGVALTPAGEDVARVAGIVEAELHALDARLEGRGLAGRLAITTVDFLASLWMEDLLAFGRANPGLELVLTTGYSAASLTRREADVAIRMSPSPPEHLVGRRHAEMLFAVYGSHGLVDEQEGTPDYGRYPWLSWELGISSPTDRWLAEAHPEARVVLRVDRIRFLLDALHAGVGITILPCVLGDRHGELRRVGDYFLGGTHLWVLTHEELRAAPRVRALFDAVGGWIARDRDLLEGRRPLTVSSPTRRT